MKGQIGISATKICVMGDSHLAAIRLGWQHAVDEESDVHCDMFGSQRSTMSGLTRDGSRLVTQDAALRTMLKRTGGSDHIDLSSYSRIVLVGLGLSVTNVIRLTETFAPVSCKYVSKSLISDAAFEATIVDRLRASLGGRLALMVHQATGKWPLVVPTPFQSEGVFEEGVAAAQLAALRASGSEGWVLDRFSQALATVFGAENIIYQPRETMASPITTLREYSDGNVGLLGKAEDRRVDHIHANERYGAIVVRKILDAL